MFNRVPYGKFSTRVYRTLLDPLIRPLRSKIVRVCHELGTEEVLDIATATGAQCRMLARADIQTVGLDLSEAMITAARRQSGGNLRYVQGSAYSLPFGDASFDACLLSLALHEHNEEERNAMLNEALRVLRPDGHLIVADYTRPRHTAFHIPWYVIRFIEGTAGAAHRAGFRDFMCRGGLGSLLKRYELTPHRRMSSHFGTIGIAVVQRKR